MIADSLKVVVSYDALTVYRVDRGAGVRRAVLARDRYAEVILQHEGPIDAGITGWAITTGATVLANDAHLDPRSVQIPGTPEEPESMLVCPLFGAGGDVIGTLNVARMGDDESHFSQDEFELVQLFAGQASIALRNAEAHGAVMTQAEHDALTGLRNHGAFQREVGAADRPRAAVRPADARPRRVQGLQRLARPPRGRRAAGADRDRDGRRAARRGPRLPLRRRRVRGPAAGHLGRGRARGDRAGPGRGRAADPGDRADRDGQRRGGPLPGRRDREGRPRRGRRPGAVPRQAAPTASAWAWTTRPATRTSRRSTR